VLTALPYRWCLGYSPEEQVFLRTMAVVLNDDLDSDGVPDICDNCVEEQNSDQEDTDSDEAGDECDPCPNDPVDDIDGDGLCAEADPCPLDPLNDLDGYGVCGDIDMLFYLRPVRDR